MGPTVFDGAVAQLVEPASEDMVAVNRHPKDDLGQVRLLDQQPAQSRRA